MGTNLQHEDLLIKLRAKLNEEKIKLWEPPYILPDNDISQGLQDLAKKYAAELSLETDTILQALHELQLHSVDRSKANAEFKETGCATFRVKATVPGEKPRVLKVQKKLDIQGSELIKVVAEEIGVPDSRVKLIVNGKVIKPAQNLEDQGVKNGAQIMALILAESPEEAKKEDTMYMEMKATRDDAMLLSECADDLADDDEYMQLEDQSGKAVELPPAERRALLVGLALHERGRAAARHQRHPLALVLLLEADRHFSECSSSILKSVDNWAVLQLDIAWSYLCLQSLAAASDAAARLARAEDSFKRSYGEDHQRLIALKGTAANERVLLMRLYLLQGIVAYHQNKRGEAKALLDKAENELNFLRVDEGSVSALMELGWSRAQARAGLRAAGQRDRAHHYLQHTSDMRRAARDRHKQDRQRRQLGLCLDGSAVRASLVDALAGMGYGRGLATRALRRSNNHAAEAVRLIQEQADLLADSDASSDDTQSPSSDESAVEPDEKLVAELVAMGYDGTEAGAALRISRNSAAAAVELLLAGGGPGTAQSGDGLITRHAEHTASCHSSERVQSRQTAPAPSPANPSRGNSRDCEDPANPSTSSGAVSKKRQKKTRRDKKRREREQALGRLSSAIRTGEDDHLDAELLEEEEFLAQYKSLL